MNATYDIIVKEEKYIDIITGEELIKKTKTSSYTTDKDIHFCEMYYNSKNDWHRTDGPAIYYTKSKNEYWYQNGNLSNLNGPAVIYGNNLSPEYWVDGVEYTELEFKIQVRKKKMKNI